MESLIVIGGLEFFWESCFPSDAFSMEGDKMFKSVSEVLNTDGEEAAGKSSMVPVEDDVRDLVTRILPTVGLNFCIDEAGDSMGGLWFVFDRIWLSVFGSVVEGEGKGPEDAADDDNDDNDDFEAFEDACAGLRKVITMVGDVDACDTDNKEDCVEFNKEPSVASASPCRDVGLLCLMLIWSLFLELLFFVWLPFCLPLRCTSANAGKTATSAVLIDEDAPGKAVDAGGTSVDVIPAVAVAGIADLVRVFDRVGSDEEATTVMVGDEMDDSVLLVLLPLINLADFRRPVVEGDSTIYVSNRSVAVAEVSRVFASPTFNAICWTPNPSSSSRGFFALELPDNPPLQDPVLEPDTVLCGRRFAVAIDGFS
jgi:hypothetical protein